MGATPTRAALDVSLRVPSSGSSPGAVTADTFAFDGVKQLAFDRALCLRQNPEEGSHAGAGAGFETHSQALLLAADRGDELEAAYEVVASALLADSARPGAWFVARSSALVGRVELLWHAGHPPQDRSAGSACDQACYRDVVLCYPRANVVRGTALSVEG